MKKGFTLIELLVVIAIIAILAAVALIQLQDSQTEARDSRRIADTNALQSAVLLYSQENTGVPVVEAGEDWADLMLDLDPYIPTIIEDPVAGKAIVYCSGPDLVEEEEYLIGVILEHSNDVEGDLDTVTDWDAGERCVTSTNLNRTANQVVTIAQGLNSCLDGAGTGSVYCIGVEDANP